jgi:hypothetical protein
MAKLATPNPEGFRNAFTTHPKVRARREKALDRVSSKQNKDAASIEQAALVRRLAQRKQGSAK